MRSAGYDIVIAGEMPDDMALSFAPLEVRSGDGVTVINGRRLDQAALQAMLTRLSDLGLTLLRIEIQHDR